MNSKKHSDIRFEFVSLNYDRTLEIDRNKNNPEVEDYSNESLTGKFRNIEKYKNNFDILHYDINQLLNVFMKVRDNLWIKKSTKKRKVK